MKAISLLGSAVGCQFARASMSQVLEEDTEGERQPGDGESALFERFQSGDPVLAPAHLEP
jgi:hypothetical protein